MATKVKGTKLFFSQFGGEQPIPPEFIAAMDRREEVQAVPNDVGAEALDGTIVESKVETNRTDERVRKTVRKKPGNITLRAVNTNDQGQPVQVTRTLFPTGTTPTAPTATTNVAVKDLGNGWSIQEVGVEGSYDGSGNFVPGVFNRASVADTGEAAELDREIQHFFVDYKREVTSSVAAGTSTTPTTLAMPTTVVALATGTGVIGAEKERVDANKVRTNNTTVSASSLGSLGGIEFDKETGTVNAITREVVVAGAAGAAINSSGVYSEITPINTRFSIKTTRKALSAFSRSYNSYETVSKLPRVLTTFDSVVFVDKAHRDPYGNQSSESVAATALHPAATYPAYENPYHINSGGNILHAGFDIALTDYNGEYLVAVEDEWSNAPFNLTSALATKFQPKGFSWTTPFGSGSVPECLHGTITISYSTGTTHPQYAYIVGSYVFVATAPALLTGTIIIEHSQTSYAGGYRRIKKSITI